MKIKRSVFKPYLSKFDKYLNIFKKGKMAVSFRDLNSHLILAKLKLKKHNLVARLLRKWLLVTRLELATYQRDRQAL